MARTAGVSDIAEVVERFRTQNQTSSSLTNQQSNAETDVREMGVLKEDLERRYSEVKFLGQDDIGDAREKIDEIELLIEDNMSRKGAALEHIKYITKRQEHPYTYQYNHHHPHYHNYHYHYQARDHPGLFLWAGVPADRG